MAYWFNDNIRFEEKYSRPNRLIMGLRYWSPEKTIQSYIFLNENITTPTYEIEKNDETRLRKTASFLNTHPTIKEYPIRVYLAQSEGNKLEKLRAKYPNWQFELNSVDRNVFHISTPNDKRLYF